MIYWEISFNLFPVIIGNKEIEHLSKDKTYYEKKENANHWKRIGRMKNDKALITFSWEICHRGVFLL